MVLFLFTDFGRDGPYVGEIRAVLARAQNSSPIIDLMHDAPKFNPHAGGYLLAALSQRFQVGDYCLAIVDPGVGHDARRALVLHADGITYFGPDNGLFAVIATTAEHCDCSEILWRPSNISDSFHGRDLFAPAVLMEMAEVTYAKHRIDNKELHGYGCPESLNAVIYIDAYGNCITGLRAKDIDTAKPLSVNGLSITHARTFSMVAEGTLFWYINSMGLVELACNQGNAAATLGLSVGAHVQYERNGQLG